MKYKVRFGYTFHINDQNKIEAGDLLPENVEDHKIKDQLWKLEEVKTMKEVVSDVAKKVIGKRGPKVGAKYKPRGYEDKAIKKEDVIIEEM